MYIDEARIRVFAVARAAEAMEHGFLAGGVIENTVPQLFVPPPFVVP